MKRDFFDKHRFFIMAVLCATFFATGYRVAAYSKTLGQNDPSFISEELKTSIDPDAKTNAKTKLYYIRSYKKSDTTTISQEHISVDLLNLDRASFELKNQDWTVIDFSPEKIFMEKDIENFGPGSFTLTTKWEGSSERLELYEYDEEGKQVLREQLNTPIENFTPTDLTELRQGITVFGEDELIRLLENYSEGF
jgi:hypothetical protein